MKNPNEISTLDALADAVAERLEARLSLGSTGIGGADAETPPRLPPPGQLDDPTPRLGASARVAIESVEYTQSVQYHSLVPPSYGKDNSIPLVAYKTLVARAYPTVRRGAFGSDPLSGVYVTGELALSIGDRVIYRTGPTRATGARLGPAASIDRTLWDREITVYGIGGLSGHGPVAINCPLNFVVPAHICRAGRIYASIRLWPVADGPISARSAAATGYLPFIDVQAPKVCLVRVNWVDAAGNVNRPTDAAMLGTLKLAERMLPFPYFETTILGTEVTSSAAFAMAATGGGCNTAWSDLVTDLSVTRIFTALFQLGSIVYGVVPPAAIPPSPGPINTGCGRGAGGGFAGFGQTCAHELGHLYERPHVAVQGDPANDTSYPNYGGSATSIGEVGIDTGTSPPTLFDPSSSDDIMSYGSNQWVSPYTYQKILDARGMHQSAPVDPRRLRPLFVLAFRMHREGLGAARVELKTAAHVKAAGMAPPRAAGSVSPVSIDLLDRNRRVLSTHHCRYVAPHGGRFECGCGGGGVPLEREPWLDFTEAIEWPCEGVAAIAFHRGEEALHTIEVGEPPRVAIEGPERRESRLVVRVHASHPRERASVVVLFSADDGAAWQPIAFEPPNGEVIIETDRLQGGERCLFRAIGTAELQSAAADTDPFELPRAPRRVFIDAPSDTCGIPAGPVALAALVDTRGLGPIAPREIRWTSSLDGDLGGGYSLTAHLNEGRHEVTVTAPDGVGGRLQERAIIVVGGKPEKSA